MKVCCVLFLQIFYSFFLSGTIKAIIIGTLAHISAILLRLKNTGTEKTGIALEIFTENQE